MIALACLLVSGCSNPFIKKLQNTPSAVIDQVTQAVSEKTEKNPATIEEKLAAQSGIKKFADLDEAKEFLEQMAVSDTYYNYRGMKSVDDMLWGNSDAKIVGTTALGAPQSKNEASINSSNDYSKTNIQVEGVDEADIVKSDGEYIYAISKNDLFIIKAYPAEQAEIVSKIQFKSRPSDIYINNGKLAVFGGDPIVYTLPLYKSFKRQSDFTFFKIFDLGDKKNPKLIRELEIEGTYTDSRMIGDYVYLITTDYNYNYIDDEPVLPRILEKGEVVPEKCTENTKCYAPDVYYFDIPYTSYNFTSVNAININNNEEPVSGDLYLMSNTQNTYVSPSAMYITYTKYLSEEQIRNDVLKEFLMSRLPEKDQKKITEIEKTENYILTPEEKRLKIEQVIKRFIAGLTPEEQDSIEKELDEKIKQKYTDISKELEKTVIHKIALEGKDIKYENFGEVTGNVLNQFSMDENSGYFRIATTKNSTWLSDSDKQDESYNNLFVLDQNLKTVGSLEKIAEGERIYSVRFIGNRAYMVTFKQTDPLFVIDLSEPSDPKILGQLKIPGFSNYLHPYDENTLIGLGKETVENQWGGVTTKGIKLSLFDVSNVSEPKEIDSYTMGGTGSDSLALNDHKAFLFSRDKNLLSIPVSLNENSSGNWGRLSFSGAMVFNVDKSGFKLKGKIDHSDGGRSSDMDFWNGYNFYDNSVQRSLYIQDELYTLSNNYLMANKTEDLKLSKKLELKKERSDNKDFIIIN